MKGKESDKRMGLIKIAPDNTRHSRILNILSSQSSQKKLRILHYFIDGFVWINKRSHTNIIVRGSDLQNPITLRNMKILNKTISYLRTKTNGGFKKVNDNFQKYINMFPFYCREAGLQFE